VHFTLTVLYLASTVAKCLNEESSFQHNDLEFTKDIGSPPETNYFFGVMPNRSLKFYRNLFATFYVIQLTESQTNKQPSSVT